MANRDLLEALRLQKGIDRGKNLLIGPCAEIVDSRRSEVFIRVPTPFTPSPSSHLGRRDLCRGIMDRCREKTSTFFTKLAYGVGKKLYPTVVPLSRSLGSPAPQTSLSTSLRIVSLDRMLTFSISLSQFSNSRTSLFFPFSLTSLRTRHGPPVIMHGSAFNTVGGLMITFNNGWSFYGH